MFRGGCFHRLFAQSASLCDQAFLVDVRKCMDNEWWMRVKLWMRVDWRRKVELMRVKWWLRQPKDRSEMSSYTQMNIKSVLPLQHLSVSHSRVDKTLFSLE